MTPGRWPLAARVRTGLFFAVVPLGIAAGILCLAGSESTPPRVATPESSGPDGAAAPAGRVATPPSYAVPPRMWSPVQDAPAPPSRPEEDSPCGTEDPDTLAPGSAFEIVDDDDTRDPAFADRRESFINDQMAASLARLAPGAEIENLECMSESCLVALRLPDDGWATSVAQWLPWGDVRELRKVSSDDAGDHYELAAVYTPDSLDHGRFEANTADWLLRAEPEIMGLMGQDLDGTESP